MTISEPATLVTDYLLAAFTAVLARRLFRSSREAAAGSPASASRGSTWWWAVAFTATAVAGFAGGTVHGFRDALGPRATEVLWLVAIEGLVAAAFAVIRATLIGSRLNAAGQRAATLAAGAAFLVYGVWVIGNPRFVFAIAAYGAALVVLVAFKLSAWRTDTRALRWLLAGVGVSALAAVVQQARWSPHQHFNHNDLYHVIQALGVWLLYRGGRGVGGRG